MDEPILNPMGNLAQRGMIAGDEREVFLALPGGLVRLRDGKADLLYEGDCSHLNLREETLCFLDNRTRIIEMDREGGGLALLAERTGTRYDEISHMVVQGNRLYYSVYWGGSVCCIDLESHEERFLLHATCLSLAVDDAHLYYVDEPTGVIQRLLLAELDQLLAMSRIRLAELWFEEHELSTDMLPDFMRRGMAEKIDLSMLLEPEALNEWDGCYSLQPVDGAVLYLACEEDEEETVCYLQAVNTESGEVVQFIEDPVDAFNMTEDWIILKKTDDGCIYRLPFERGEEKRIMGDEVDRVYVVGNRIWCTHPAGDRLTRIYADGSGKEVIRLEV